MEAVSALLSLRAGNSPVIGEFPAQRPVTRSFDVSFDLSLNKRLSKNLEAGDLRRHRAHHDVSVFLWHRIIYLALKQYNAGYKDAIWFEPGIFQEISYLPAAF